MAEEPARKKTMREELEEYKRRQRLDEARAQSRGEPPAAEESDDDDSAADDDEDADEEAWVADLDEANRRAAASGAHVGKIVSSVFLLVGLALLVVSAGVFWFARQSVAAEVSAPGVVVSNVLRHYVRSSQDASRPQGSSDLYHAVVEFALPDGAKKTVEMAEGNWPKAFDEGEKVVVRYDPAKPLKARLGGGSAMDFFASLLTGFLGAVFTAIAMGVKKAFA